jgi:alkanesulfonate monooxygenase SsuD/methylene tetrahydromethanopterin reductase-like flavin-dependent oxidoreductase (luciferase family)
VELGIYTFGNTPRPPDGSWGAASHTIPNVFETAQQADSVGLNVFGFGEHHMRSMPVSSPTSLVIAAAASTKRIKLSTAVSVLSTDDPISVLQQLATASATASGRIEMVAGRGSWPISFPIFDQDEVAMTCSSSPNLNYCM